ncbi:MAG: hypothetical protein PHC70_00400 [Patescibacteria group bacterium]|nr:hypothetical protein [Patescibacteria group bacterium]
MSLACGCCRETIYEGFGILYRLEQRAKGILLLPGEIKIDVPNCAICDKCWGRLPESQRLVGEEIRQRMSRGSKPVYIFMRADSDRGSSLLGSAKQWSSIRTEPSTVVYIRTPLVLRHFKGAVEIIDGMANALQRERADIN